MMTIENEYVALHHKSEMFHRWAQELLPSGVVHDARFFTPFPFYVTRASGSKKWDVDSNEYIDYWAGHGALILGHNHPDVVAAVTEQMHRGFHYSACHELEMELAELVIKLIPCAEKVRFQQSGTEANMLAIRLARAYTGKSKIIKFRGHFHGLFDEGILAVRAPFDTPMSIGTPKGNVSNVLLANHNSSEDVRRLVKSNDVACVIMDPAGAHGLMMPNRPGFLREIRQITKENRVVLIFDEIVSGFRYAPGGAQEALGVIPDLTTLAKTLGGGLPGSAVAGKKEIMDVMTFTGDPVHDRHHRVRSQGTHSANVVVCAAGIATLKILSTGEVQAHLNQAGAKLRKAMNEKIKKHGIPGCAYGDYSIVHVLLGHDWPELGHCDTIDYTFDHEKVDAGMKPDLSKALHLAMLLNGVDYCRWGGTFFLMEPNIKENIEKTVEAFDRALVRLKQEKVFDTKDLMGEAGVSVWIPTPEQNAALVRMSEPVHKKERGKKDEKRR